MFEDYKKELLAFYLHKKETHQLSGNLENLQRSNLRKECLNVLAEKNTKKDHEIIKAFFDPTGRFNDPIASIERVELDKFRPLVSFLQEGIRIRDDASVKLIAWLVGFYSYQEWKLIKAAEQVDDDEPEIPDIIIERLFSIKNAAISCITILFLAGGVFFLVEKNTSDTIRQPLADEKCMYWTGNHYEPVKCDEKIKNATIIPINLRVLNNLKRINVTDTLTSYSLGKVWYLNIRRKPEFFTDSGMHPVETSKKLKPLSKHILSNHVSYYRYLLVHLIWLICVIITVVLFMVCLMYFLRRKKRI